MTLPTNNEFANQELSIDELDAVAAGSILGDIYNWIKGEVNGKVNEYKTFGRMMIDVGRSLYHLF